MAYTGSHWESLNAEARLERDINLMLAGREQVIRESGYDPRGKVMGNASNVLAYSAGAFTARMAVPAVMRSFFRSASDLTRR